VELVILKTLENLFYMLMMFRVNQNIVDVDDDELVEEVSKYLVHVVLEDGR